MKPHEIRIWGAIDTVEETIKMLKLKLDALYDLLPKEPKQPEEDVILELPGSWNGKPFMMLQKGVKRGRRLKGIEK